ncbi:MAG: tRNA lysidine(34) synthetase TilS [Desulfovibrionales bacterium]
MSPDRLQDLPPQWAHALLGVERFVTQELGIDPGGKHILVGLSGGPDSTALLLFCRLFQNRWQSTISAGHLDHRLRPESGQEADHVRRLCAEFNIECSCEEADVAAHARQQGTGLEETARTLRYEFLERTRKAYSADYLFTGHTLNDLAEEIVLRLLRGTGWPALSGMPAVDPKRSLVRPFLLTPKKTLTGFLRAINVSWTEDPSNLEPLFRRNRIRLDVVPRLEEENPLFLSAVARLWQQGARDSGYWQEQLRRLAPSEMTTARGVLLPEGVLAGEHPALRIRWYKKALDSLGPGQVRTQGLENLEQAFVKQSTGTIIQFPGNKRATLVREGILFSPDPAVHREPE